MATATALPSGPPSSNRRIFDILQGATKISQELRGILEPAAEAFHAKSYKTAAKYYTTALDSLFVKDEKRQNQIVVLTKYMLCMCWLESTDAKDLLDSLRNLEDLERTYGYQYPMLYYAVGKAYFKLYRFNKADVTLKKGFSVLNGDSKVVEYNIPGTNIVIPESSKDRLVAALVSLNDQCSSWHRPDAVCCMADCSSHSQNEGADKHIFFGSPTFNGMVQVSCNNTSNFCTMNFHLACWKAKKEELCSLKKMSDKEVLNWECFTPNCENHGIRCTIKKIEIYDENAEIKASMARAEDGVWHAKPTPQPKGAIRKQQQQQIPKAKVSSTEARAARPQFVPNNATTHNNSLTHRMKIEKEENEEEDDIHDEQALKASLEKLAQLRASNFGIKDDAIWRPDLQMYGNEYMLATAELMPDPDFTDEGIEESDLKIFVFSYFHSFIAENGPVKLDVLFEKWNEASTSFLNADCDRVLKHYSDISEFLLQSVKFAVVGDFICVAERLPEAYELAKSDTCEILRFFMENDIDQRSNSSSVDDEAVFDALVNQEKNNNSLPYSSVSGDDKLFTKECGVIWDDLTDNDRRYDDESLVELEATQDAALGPPPTPKIPKTHPSPESNSNDQENPTITALELTEACKTVEEKEPIVPSETATVTNSKLDTATRTCGQKRPHSSESADVAVAAETAEPNVKKECEMPTTTTNGIHKSLEHEESGLSPTNASSENAKLTKPIERKLKKLSLAAGNPTKESESIDDLPASDSPTVDDDTKMSHSGDTANQAINTNKGLLLMRLARQNGVKNLDNTSISQGNQQPVQESDLLKELIDELQNLTAVLEENKGKTRHLESELEHVKRAHGAMRIRMLQKSLQSQYNDNRTTIMMKIEECRRNSEICAGIQSILMNSIGQSLPNYGAEWLKTMAELEQISKNHQMKFWEIDDQLYTSGDPEKLKELNLQPEILPSMPQTKLIDVIQEAMDIQRMHQMKEFQRMQALSNPPLPTSTPTPTPTQTQTPTPMQRPTQTQTPTLTQTSTSTSAPMIRSPPDQPQSQPVSMFAVNPPYGSVANYYEGPQLLQGNRGHHEAQTNHLLSLNGQQPIFMSTHRNSANPVPLNLQYNQSVPPPVANLSFFPAVYPGIPYPPIASPAQQMQQNASALAQQQVFPVVQPGASGKTQRNISSVRQIPSTVEQNTPSPNFTVPEPAKLAPSLPLAVPRSLPSLIQQNSQPDQSIVNLSRSKSVADLEKRAASEQSTAMISSPGSVASLVAPEVPTFLPMQELSSIPVQKKSPLVATLQSAELPAAKYSERANSVPEIPKIFKPRERVSPPIGATKENLEEPTSSLAEKAKDERCAVVKNSGTAKHQHNWKSSIHQASPVFVGVAKVNNHNEVEARIVNDIQNCETSAKAETPVKPVEKTLGEVATPGSSSAVWKEAKQWKKTEHSMDKLMRKMRDQYTGILELDLLKGVECVRKKHNNSLSKLPISRIIREAERFIVDRQQKQLCGYGKRPPSQYFAVANAGHWSVPDGDRKRQASFSSTSSANSLKKEPQNSMSKKKWEQVVMPNDNWNREIPESDCAICFETMINIASYTLQCKHTFHKTCIKNWYQLNQSCPNCRVHSTIDDEYPPLPLG